MVVFPNAKINLGLYITEKLSDGYHRIETVFYPVPLRDALEVNRCGGETEFTQTGIRIGGDPAQNLVMKAWNMMQREFKLPDVRIHLHKAIPMGAGLGGGSADAAFMLKLVNDFFSIGLDAGSLENLARRLGSDCAFFVRNKPVAGFGRGDEFEETDLDLSGYHLVIVKPQIHIGTAEAYAGVNPAPPKHDIREIIRRPVSEWKKWLVNDFENTIFKKHPQISDIKSRLYRHGALYAAMSGSGSAVYGLFTENPGLKNAFEGCFYWEGKFSGD